jgi:hypothetical protein
LSHFESNIWKRRYTQEKRKVGLRGFGFKKVEDYFTCLDVDVDVRSGVAWLARDE